MLGRSDWPVQPIAMVPLASEGCVPSSGGDDRADLARRDDAAQKKRGRSEGWAPAADASATKVGAQLSELELLQRGKGSESELLPGRGAVGGKVEVMNVGRRWRDSHPNLHTSLTSQRPSRLKIVLFLYLFAAPMAALTGIIILTAALKPLITTPFRPASLLPLYTEAFTASAAAKGKAPSTSTRATGGQNGNDDCVLWVGEGLGSLCWISRGGLYFLCGVGKEGQLPPSSPVAARCIRAHPCPIRLSSTANPLLAFRFLEVFVDVLTEYLGEVRPGWQ